MREHKNLLLKSGVFVGVVAGVVAMASMAWATGSATSNMSVTASVGATCTISAPTLAFGSYNPVTTNASTPLDAQADITITCTQGAAANVTLGNGNNFDGTASVRRMSDGSAFLQYYLYSDATRSTQWNTATFVTTTGTGLAQTLTTYGEIPAGQTSANAGAYSDTVVATVNF